MRKKKKKTDFCYSSDLPVICVLIRANRVNTRDLRITSVLNRLIIRHAWHVPFHYITSRSCYTVTAKTAVLRTNVVKFLQFLLSRVALVRNSIYKFFGRVLFCRVLKIFLTKDWLPSILITWYLSRITTTHRAHSCYSSPIISSRYKLCKMILFLFM
jgi:hypothetical protein